VRVRVGLGRGDRSKGTSVMLVVISCCGRIDVVRCGITEIMKRALLLSRKGRIRQLFLDPR